MLDRGLRATFRNFATLFFVVAIVLVPLNLVITYVYRDAVRVREIETQIRELETEDNLGADAERLDQADLVRTVGAVELVASSCVPWGGSKDLRRRRRRPGPEGLERAVPGSGMTSTRRRLWLKTGGTTRSVLRGGGSGVVARLEDRRHRFRGSYDEAAWAVFGLVRGPGLAALRLLFLLGTAGSRVVLVKGAPAS